MTIDWQVHTYASLPSTQDYVKELAEEGLPEGTVIQCLEQRHGRGRHGRDWISPIGNLYMSILLRPDCPVDQAGQLSFVAAVALSEAMDTVLTGDQAKTLKWPNDILINGRKVSGILIEKEGDAYALGMGVNILSAPEGAAFLKEFSGDNRLAIHPFRDTLLKKFGARYLEWQKEGFENVRKAWMAQAHGIGQPITVRIGETSREGVFREIDKDGFLILETEGGKTERLNSGEVFFPTLN